MGIFDECPACGKERALTRHHIKPVRHFGRKNNKDILLICRACHNELERRIPFEPALHPDEYRRIAQQFLAMKQGQRHDRLPSRSLRTVSRRS